VSSRIGKGPWARALGAVLVPDDTTPEAIRGEELWRKGAVHDLRVDVGQITGRLEACTVTLTAPTIPSRIWDAMTSYARNHEPLERAVRGELQSVHLAHLMTQDWDEPLIPLRSALASVCTCDPGAPCEHVAAVTCALAASIDLDPAALLRWRGVTGDRPAAVEAAALDAEAGEEAWRGTPVPLGSPDARRQAESVPKRLGAAGIRVADADLVDVLAVAYAAFGVRGWTP
jgi:uncharacterized Zn finger protein